MVFSSLLFLYIFLPLNLLCYAVISDIKKEKHLLTVFFACVLCMGLSQISFNFDFDGVYKLCCGKVYRTF